MSYIDAPNFDADLIRSIYLDVCMTTEWTNGSPALRDGLYSHFENECNDALLAGVKNNAAYSAALSMGERNYV